MPVGRGGSTIAGPFEQWSTLLVGPARYRLRSWLRPSWRTVALLSLLFAAVGGLALTLLAGAHRTITAPDRYSASRGAAFDVTIQQSAGPPGTRELDALPATGRVSAATFVFAGLTTAKGEAVDTLVFAGLEDPLGTRLVAGHLPDPADPSQFVATPGVLHGGHVGDHYRLATLTQDEADAGGFYELATAAQAGGPGAAPTNPTRDATLVGVIDGPRLEDDSQIALFPASLLDRGDVGVSATVAVASLARGATTDDLRAQLDQLPGSETFSIDTAPWLPDEVRAAVNAQG